MSHAGMTEQTAREYNQSLVLGEVNSEMNRQVDKWGVQQHPSYKNFDVLAMRGEYVTTEVAKHLCDTRLPVGECSWLDILNEEVLEARDEAITGNIEGLREELIQVAAVALSWVQSIDRNER